MRVCDFGVSRVHEGSVVIAFNNWFPSSRGDAKVNCGQHSYSHSPLAPSLRLGSYGGFLRPGEGEAIAAYVQQNLRVPRRGEVGRCCAVFSLSCVVRSLRIFFKCIEKELMNVVTTL